MDKLRFEFCQGVFQGRQEIADKLKVLVNDYDQSYISETTWHSMIHDLNKIIQGKD